MKILLSPASPLLLLPFLSGTIPAAAHAQPLLNLPTPLSSSSSSSIAARIEIADIYKKTLLSAPCAQIRLTDRYALRATCHAIMGSGGVDSALDLNGCFANYAGSLARVRDGKGVFGGSCDVCALRGTALGCECRVGGIDGRSRHSEVELDDWDVVQVDLDTGVLQCADTFGLE